MKPVKAYLTNTYMDLFKLYTFSAITSFRSLSTPSYHLGTGGNYPIRTDGPFMVAGFQDQSIKPTLASFRKYSP